MIHEPNRWRGGRKSPRQDREQAASSPAWKRSKHTPVGRSTKRPLGKIFFIFLLLLALVGWGIYMYQPDPKVHTHFVLLDLLKDSAHFDTVQPPEFPTVNSLTEKATQQSLGSFESLTAESLPDLGKNGVLVVCLQTQILAGPDGTLLCLIENSTPDLEGSPQYQTLATLKLALTKVAEQRPKLPMVLFIDTPEFAQQFRLGQLPVDYASELLSWPDQEPLTNLTVICSTSAGEISPIEGGQTVFGKTIAQAFSKSADANKDNQLDLVELIQFLQTETDQRVRNSHRHSGQHVQCSADLTGQANQLILFKDLKSREDSPGSESNFDDLQRLWVRYDALNENDTWRWNPFKWRMATEYLLRAQNSILNGNQNQARQLASKASKEIAALEKEPTLTQIDPQIGMPLAWYKDLPNAIRMADYWERLNDVPPALALPEEVLQANLSEYPFKSLGMPEPDQQFLDHLLKTRTSAEKATAATLSVSERLRNTILKLEEQTLLSEDQVFTRTTQNTTTPTTEQTLTWNTVREFAEKYQIAEFALEQALMHSEGLATWAANYRVPSVEYNSGWKELLSDNLPSSVLDTSRAKNAIDSVAALLQNSAIGANGTALLIRGEVFKYLLSARMLQTLLSQDEPADGFSREALKSKSDEIEHWSQQLAESGKMIDTYLERLVSQLTAVPIVHAEQLSHQATIRCTLNTSLLSAKQRQELVSAITKTRKKLAEGNPQDEASDPIDPPVNVGLQALWLAQSLNTSFDLLDDQQLSKEFTESLSEVDSSHASRAAYGVAARKLWSDGRSLIKKSLSLSSDEARQALRSADGLSRGLSAYDAENLFSPPTTRLHLLWQLDYCLLHSERLLKSQWVNPGDQLSHGWYAQSASDWLETSEQLRQKLKGSSSTVITSVGERIQQQRVVLDESSKWQLTVTPRSSEIRLPDPNIVRKPIEMTIEQRGVPHTSGIASLRCLTKDAAAKVTFSANAQPIHIDGNQQMLTMDAVRGGPPVERDCALVTYQPSVFFRGRTWASEKTILTNPCAAKEFVTQRRARDHFAEVKLSGNDQRHVVFILDYSASMTEKLSGEDGITRHQIARDTLRDVISELDEHTLASLIVFGHRNKSNEDVNTELTQTWLNDKGKKKFNDVLDELEISGPIGITPLALALKKALTVDLKNQAGIIVAITDGIATDVGLDLSGNPIPVIKKDGREIRPLDRSDELRNALKENSQSKVVVVAFDIQTDSSERTALDKVFKEKCGITDILNAKDQSELLKRIRTSLNPRPYQVSGAVNTVNVTAEFGQKISNLPPAKDYEIRFAGITTDSKRPIHLSPGDSLDLRADFDEQRFLFDRSKAPRMVQRIVNSGTGSFDIPEMVRAIEPAIYTRKTTGEMSHLELHLMLDHDDKNRPVQQPAEIEFQVSAKDQSQFRPTMITETFTSQWGAPGWIIEIDEWPNQSLAMVNAYWKMTRTPPELMKDYADLQETSALRMGGTETLPEFLMSTRLLQGGTLQIRLDPVEQKAYDEDNLVEQIRVEVGSPNLRETNSSFQPDEVTTTYRRTEYGSLIVEFYGEYTEELLKEKKIACTSKRARQQNAFTLNKPLEISDTLDRKANE